MRSIVTTFKFQQLFQSFAQFTGMWQNYAKLCHIETLQIYLDLENAFKNEN